MEPLLAISTTTITTYYYYYYYYCAKPKILKFKTHITSKPLLKMALAFI
jgi:hypothetical protein